MKTQFFANICSPLGEGQVAPTEKVDADTQLDAIVTQAAAAPTEEEKRQQELILAAEALSVSVHDDIPADVNTITIDGIATFALEGLHFVKSKAKMGKTSMLAILESVFVGKEGCWGKIKRLGNEPLKVIHADTEQKIFDTQRFKKQVLRLAGTTEEEVEDDFKVFNMRGIIDNDAKMELVEAMLKAYRPKVLVLDGIVDFIDNFNEVDESKKLIAWLMMIADTYKVALFCVLHTNKNSMDHNMRGHLGTMSEQKCDTTTECEKDEKSGIVTVKCANARHRPYNEWSFAWDEDGNLVDAEAQRTELVRLQAEQQKQERERKSQELKEERKLKAMSLINSCGGRMARAELTDRLIQAFDVSRKTVSPLITEWVKQGDLYEFDGMISTSPQTELFL